MNFAIGIPTINRADLLTEAIDRYTQTMPDVPIYICDNGYQQIESSGSIIVFKEDTNLGVAGSWNLLCETIFLNHDFALILNDDIVLGHDSDALRRWIRAFEFDLAASTKNFCSFLVSAKAFTEVGKFDEMFYPAYFEDNDYLYRLKLAGKRVVRTDFLNPQVYRNSMTIQRDPSLNDRFADNRKYYIEKWGGAPAQEKYLLPFDKP